MRIGVFGKLVVVAVLVVLGTFLFWHPAFTKLRGLSRTNINREVVNQPDSLGPQALLVEANRFYWLNNGPKAGPLYSKAEALFAQRGDARNELYAKIGRLRSESETMSFVDLSRFLGDQLNNPVVRNDAELRLWCLAAKGYAKSIVDYVFRWLERKFITGDQG